MKEHYKLFWMERQIDLTETNVNGFYSVDILPAMQAFKRNRKYGWDRIYKLS